MGFTRVQVTKEEAQKAIGPGSELLDLFDWTKTAVFHETESGETSGCYGYRVVHFKDRVEEKWHSAYAQTWFGLGAWMS